ncbi:MAG: ribbon-helix-helix protein, CopG family [Deltaproteobacteria bacterium]|nr:ribbon-helix-helix protein, CopG family [Deltaproteobacteria bacterium]MBI3386423.1 ribbon-helix-helix protein, CopG family [Deltaproteobacteria bacterium]
MRPSLMLGDLLEREPVAERLLSVRLPVELLDRLDRLARALHTRKGEIVVAMLNEGLSRFGKKAGRKRSK